MIKHHLFPVKQHDSTVFSLCCPNACSPAQSFGRMAAWSIIQSIARAPCRSFDPLLGRSVDRLLGRSVAQSLGRSLDLNSVSLGGSVAWTEGQSK